MQQIDRHADAASRHDNFVSPYLLRRLRSYKEAVHQRRNPPRPGKVAETTRSDPLKAAASKETAASRSDR